MIRPTYALIACLAVLSCSTAPSSAVSQPLSSIDSEHAISQGKMSRFSPIHVLNGITKTNFNANSNIAYGQHPRQQLDVYMPQGEIKNSPLKPVILFVHGGAWTTGNKDDYLFVGESFSSAGYVTAVMNYRLAPQHQYPDYVQDTALALKWINQHIQQYGGDPSKIIVMGHSAGAFNAVEAVDNARWLKEVNLPVSNIKAVVGIAGPYSYDFRTDDSIHSFPAHATPDEVMPDRHVRQNAPPHLLLTGSNDHRVKLSNTLNMHQALQQKGAPVQHIVIKGATHISIMASVATRLSWYKPTREVILTYLDQILSAEK